MFDKPTLATILAGLRRLQHPNSDIEDIITDDDGQLILLSDEQIDELCERLNTATPSNLIDIFPPCGLKTSRTSSLTEQFPSQSTLLKMLKA